MLYLNVDKLHTSYKHPFFICRGSTKVLVQLAFKVKTDVNVCVLGVGAGQKLTAFLLWELIFMGFMLHVLHTDVYVTSAEIQHVILKDWRHQANYWKQDTVGMFGKHVIIHRVHFFLLSMYIFVSKDL